MYKTRSKILAISLITTLILSACVFAQDTSIEGSGVVAEETRELSGVTEVRLTMDADLNITIGDSETLTISGEDNIFAYILSDVDGGSVTIQNRPRIELEPTEPISFELTVKTLNSIEVTNGNVEISELDADALAVKVSGSGSLTISDGKVKSQTITISGSGSYDAVGLECDEAEIKVSGDGTATIWVNNQLTADLSGDAAVSYKGDPTVGGKSTEGLTQIGN